MDVADAKAMCTMESLEFVKPLDPPVTDAFNGVMASIANELLQRLQHPVPFGS